MAGLKDPLLPPGDAEARNSDAGIKPATQRPVAVDFLFLKRVWRLMVIARAGWAFVLVILSIFSVVIVSRAGLVIGHFYLALINKDMQLLWDAIRLSLLWYGAESICSAAQVWTAELLALHWRKNLTDACHPIYLTGSNLCALNSPVQIVDNPDERVTQELYNFSQALAQFMLKTIASPLMIVYYTWWVWKYVGWYGPVTVYFFFVVGATVTRSIISPIAGLVARQEKLEAFFRISHVRIRRNAESIALNDSGALEQTELERKFGAVLQNQRKLVTRHCWLDFVTKAYSYLGSILNYCVVGLAVFGGRYDQGSSGDVANMISNVSFSVLQLIFSFTQVIETAKMVSDLAGYTVRVAELFEALDLLPAVSDALPDTADTTSLSPKKCRVAQVNDDSANGGPAALLGLSEDSVEPDLTEFLAIPPSHFRLQDSRVLEYSVHFSPLEIRHMLADVFPEVDPRAILVITTFQPAAINLWPAACCLYEDGSTSQAAEKSNLEVGVQEEMSTLANLFLAWQQEVTDRLKSAGHWADAVHPWTGLPIGISRQSGSFEAPSSTSPSSAESTVLEVSDGPKFRQVDAARVLFGYASIDVGCGNVLVHSKYFTRCFPASVFTTAPLGVLLSAIQSVQEVYTSKAGIQMGDDGAGNVEATWVSENAAVPGEVAALICDNLTLKIPRTQQLIVQSLNLRVKWGESLLITGPTGSGKTSLLRAIGGVWPLQSGRFWVPPRLEGKGVLFIPQTPLLVKGGLAAQICYPDQDNSSTEVCTHRLREALQAVGMVYLLDKVTEEWQKDIDIDTLSPGEKQSLSLARVLYHRPQLAIMDEATSALNEEAEDRIYKHIMKLGITVVSVAHRRSLFHYHTNILHIQGDGEGSWAIN